MNPVQAYPEDPDFRADAYPTTVTRGPVQPTGHTHLLSADQFASRPTSMVSEFQQGYELGRDAQATGQP